MKDKETNKKIKEKQKRIVTKGLPKTLALLLLPVFLLQILVVCAPSTYFLSLLLTYFILPMFYTVEKRLRFAVSGIGKDNFSYKDGYDSFFGGVQGGIFGVIFVIIEAFLVGILCYFLVSLASVSIINCFEGANDVYQHMIEMMSSPNASMNELMEYLMSEGHLLIQPLTVIVGLVVFIPELLIVFYFLNTNLDDHYLCTIVLPDIDKNISASQARSICRSSFGRPIRNKRLSISLGMNWPYYLAFTIFYGVILYVCSFITSSNIMLLPLIVMIAPTISLFFGMFLDYFCLGNEYAVLEVISGDLVNLLPLPMQESISRTYNDPHYNHGEESAIRGAFIPPRSYDSHDFGNNSFRATDRGFNPSGFESEGTYQPKDSSDDSSKEDEQPTGVVIDLSSQEKKKNSDKGDKK